MVGRGWGEGTGSKGMEGLGLGAVFVWSLKSRHNARGRRVFPSWLSSKFRRTLNSY